MHHSLNFSLRFSDTVLMLQRFKNTVLAFVGASILLHIFLGSAVYLSDYIQPTEEAPIEVEFISPSQKDFQQPQQIVEQSKKPLNDEIPEDARFLSQHNQRVKKETTAEASGAFQNQAQQGQNGQQKNAKTPPPPSQKREPLHKDGLPKLANLKPKFNWSESAHQKQQEEHQQQAGQRSQNSDYLKDTDKGIQTLLNTREFVYFSYYQRIRSKIRQYWEPKIREKVTKILSQGRNIASAQDRITKVIIILNKEGTLVNVKVIGNSGISDLDDAAVEAFRAAEPFPNPPNGIVETDGTIKIRWDFVLEA